MSVLAWVYMLMTFLSAVKILRSAASGGPVKTPTPAYVLIAQILFFVGMVALSGRVLAWW